MSCKVLIAGIIIIALVAGVMAIPAADPVSVSVSDDSKATFAFKEALVSVDTQIGGQDFKPAEVQENNGVKKLSSGEKSLFIFSNPVVIQEYKQTGDTTIEDTVILKERKDLSYRVTGGTLSYDGDGIRIGYGHDENGYLYMQPAYGWDGDGKVVNFAYKITGDTITVVIPSDMKFPVTVDPVIEAKYSLKLLIHANIEAADGFSTTTIRDSSTNPKMPYFQGSSANFYNLNTTNAPKFGNASIFLREDANITIQDSDDFWLSDRNFTYCAWVNWSGTPRSLDLFNQTASGTSYQRFTIDGATASAITWAANNGTAGETATFTFTTAYAPIQGKWSQYCVIRNGSAINLTLNGSNLGVGSGAAILKNNIAAPVEIGRNFSTAGSAINLDEAILFNGWGAPIGSSLLNSEWPLYVNTTTSGANLGYADDNQTASLLHFDTADGSTFFRDEVANRTWTITFGTSNIRNVSAKFSPAGYNATGNAVISANAGSVWDFGSEDWTIEGWMKFPIATPSNSSYLSYSTDAVKGYSMYCIGTACVINSNQSGSYAADLVGYTTFENNVYSHIVFTRNGTTLRIFKDGNVIGQTTISAGAKFNSAGNFLIIVNNGTLDEYRVSKGIARYTANFTPQSTPFGITTPSFVANITESGTAPVTVQFNDTTIDSAWTQNGYYWDWGDSTAGSTERNTTHTYTAPGTYTITHQTFNNNQSAITTSVFVPGKPVITLSASPSNGTAALSTDLIISLSNTTPVSIWNISFGDGSQSTETPFLSSGSGSSTMWRVPHVYSSFGLFNASAVVTNSYGSDTAYTYITVSTSQNQILRAYIPVQTRFRIMDLYGKPLPGTSVSANYIQASVPANFMTDAFYISPDIVNEMLNSTTVYNGTTDDNGGLTFPTFQSIQYQLNITNSTSGVYATKSIFPSDSEYVIYVRTAGQTAANNTLTLRNSTLPWYSINSSYISVNMSYIDSTLCTGNVTFRVWFRNNGSELYNNTQNAAAGGWVNDSYLLPKNPIGIEYLWGSNATTKC